MPDSDSQLVRSQDDTPILVLAEYGALPSDAPYSVALTDPDAAPFCRDTTLTRPAPLDKSPVALPTLDPPLIASARDMPLP